MKKKPLEGKMGGGAPTKAAVDRVNASKRGAASKAKKIDCLKCEHFFVTWNKSFPRGCNAYGFKTKRIPSMDVLSSSGTECKLFKLKSKEQKRAASKGEDKGGIKV